MGSNMIRGSSAFLDLAEDKPKISAYNDDEPFLERITQGEKVGNVEAKLVAQRSQVKFGE